MRKRADTRPLPGGVAIIRAAHGKHLFAEQQGQLMPRPVAFAVNDRDIDLRRETSLLLVAHHND